MPLKTEEFERALDEMTARIDEASKKVVEHYTDELKKEAAATVPNESGRGTGVIASSFTTEFYGYLHVYRGKVGPSDPGHARRIELGLHRADKRGRVYHQKGTHWMEKAKEKVYPEFERALEAAWAAAMEV